MAKARVTINGGKTQEKTVRDRWFLDFQQRNPHKIYKNKKHYQRRHKYQGKNYAY